ncbi:MAG TPA: 3-deoxy-D-manno-octulosonic acid transferase [Terriglobia bacterium]|nr:3-deoxy-D-manno-octulosonic acid transferase [Terriglobia bacterium]
MYLAYSFLFTLGILLAAPYYLWRYRGKGLPRGYWRERFGVLPRSFQQPPVDCRALWVHAVSLGETLAVAGLVREIQQLDPMLPIFVSNVTPTGRAASETRMMGLAGRFYLPFDWRSGARRALRRLQPAMLLIVETELWPNLLAAAHQHGTRIVIVNARLSGRSFRGYRFFRPFVRRVLENVDWVFAQTPGDAERYRALGAAPERVVVAGNLKFDAALPQPGPLPARLQAALKDAGRAPVVVAASTMPGEEPLVLRAWREISERYPRALLLLAPRHPARFDQAAGLLASEGGTFVRRTALETGNAGLVSQLGAPSILLLDSVGELAGLFQLADVVFMGGSLVPAGGHNLLEPAFWSKPVVFGPHMENFRDAAGLFLKEQAAIQVRDTAGLTSALLKLLDDAGLRKTLGKNAKQILERESGATRRILAYLRPWLEPVPEATVQEAKSATRGKVP